MKKLITLALIMGATIFTQAQSNLVFNQALIVELTTSSEQIVPEGKVWKVESMSAVGLNILVDDSEWSIGTNGNFRNMPAWFPAGTSLKGTNPASNYLSVLEFNVVAISSSSGGGSGGGDSGSGISNGDGAISGIDYSDGPSLTDGDGNIYETVQINNQIWTTSNLDVSTYRDGTPIPYISDFEEWCTTSTGAYTYAGQDSETGSGKLYNAYAVIGKNDNDNSTPFKELAPEGYHIPAWSEWDDLVRVYYIFGIDGTDPNFVSQYLRSETTWDLAGNNESGLNIKKFPAMLTGNQLGASNNNWSSINDDNYTLFASSFISGYYTNDLGVSLYGLRIENYILQLSTFSNYNSLAGNNIIAGNAGAYVRLLKDN